MSKDALRAHTLAVIAKHPELRQFIDISKYQWGHPIDFVAVKASGIEVVAIKATEGAHIVDAYYHRAYDAAKAAGLRVSPYLFYRPGEDIGAQVALFAKTVGHLASDDLLPTVDLERATPDLSAKQDNDRLAALLESMRSAFGKWPMIYTSRRYCEQEGLTVGGQCFVWVVDYVNSTAFKVPAQFPREHVAAVQIGYAPGVAGISGDVDRDLAFLPWEALALFDRHVPAEVIDTSALDAPFVLPPDLH